MTKLSKEKKNILIVFSAMLLAVLLILLVIFIEGKQVYTVTFELEGGTLVSGELTQYVLSGNNATAPSVERDGYTLRSWSKSYRYVTEDLVIKAVWEHDFSYGLIYSEIAGADYTEVIGAYEYVGGEVHIGSFYGERKILGIAEGAFSGNSLITELSFDSGIISIGNGAFSGCTALESVKLPASVRLIGSEAFSGCTSLSEVLIRAEEELADNDCSHDEGNCHKHHCK